ncbi:MAG TPA: sugar kinase [Halomonas sp.]|nr:sugar kinase [Halomonas sp.]
MPSHRKDPDILAFGEAMTMFVADSVGDLSDVEHFQRRIAGADTNVAIGLARLGFHVGWLSRVGDDSFGRYIRATLEREGLDCRHLHNDTDHATGLVFKERAEGGADPRVEYFRRNSAASQLSPADADGVAFASARHLHATGIPPAISASCRDLSWHMLESAQAAGASISFDPNLRPGLWASEAEMRETLNAMAAMTDWVLPGLSEGRRLTGLDTPHDIAGFYLDRGAQAVIIKLGPEGSYYRGKLGDYGDKETSFTVAGFPVTEVVDTVGAGDGFAVGVVSALLEGLPPRQALRRGNLIGAQAVQVLGDMEGLPSRSRLQSLEAAHNE